MTLPSFTLRDRLRKAREHAGLMQADLAAQIGISTVSLSRYESGVRKIPDSIVEPWAEATGVPAEWFYADDAGSLPHQTPADTAPEPLQEFRVRWTDKGVIILPEGE